MPFLEFLFVYVTTKYHRVTNMTSPRCYMGVAAAADSTDEYIYAIGGMSGFFSPTQTVERYSVSKDEWTVFDPLPVSEGGVVGFAATNSTSERNVGGDDAGNTGTGQAQALFVFGGFRAYTHTL